MKAPALFLMSMLLLFFSTGFSQSLIESEQVTQGLVVAPTIDDCFEGNFSEMPPVQFPELQNPNNIFGNIVTDNFDYVINKDCPPDFDIPYYIHNSGQCGWFRVELGSSIFTRIEIKLDGKSIQSVPFNSLPGTIEGTVNLSGVTILSGFDTPKVYDLTIEVCKTTTVAGPGGSYTYTNCDALATKSILMLSTGEQFLLQAAIDATTAHSCDDVPSFLQGLGACDDPGDIADPGPIEVICKFSDVRAEGNKIQVFGGIEGSANVSSPKGWHDLFSLSGSISGGINWTHDWSHIQSNFLGIGYPLTIDPPEGKCQWASVSFNVVTVSSVPVTVTCTGLESNEDPFLTHQVTNFGLVTCTSDQLNDGDCTEGCPPGIETFINGNGNFNGDFNAAKNSDGCSFDIIATPCPDLEQMEFYSWVYPDGTVVAGPGISNVPIGIYILQVSDECGDFYEIEVNACPDLSIGEWDYVEDEKLICAPVICNGADCGPGYEYSACVEPEISECTYDETTGMICQTISCPEGTPCEEDFVPIENCVEAIVSDWVYDEVENQFCRMISCPAETFCDGCFIEVEECVDGTYGEWTYNDWDEQCERDILINGEPSGEIDISEAVFIYTYDDFFDQCIRITVCGETEVLEETEDPQYGNWSIEDDFFDGVICEREVICFGDSENNSGWDIDVNTDPDIEWEYDDFWEECDGYVFCDGFGDWNEEGVLDGDVSTDWDYNDWYKHCEGVISCSYNGAYVDNNVEEVEEDRTVISWEVNYVAGGLLCDVVIGCGHDGYQITTQEVFDSEFSHVDDGVNICRIYCAKDEGSGTSLYLPCGSGFSGEDTNTLLLSNQEWEEVVINKRYHPEIEVSVSITPNPTTGLVTINYAAGNLKGGHIEVISINGQVVQKQLITNDLPTIQMDINSLINGLYFIRVTDANNNEVYQDKVVKID